MSPNIPTILYDDGKIHLKKFNYVKGDRTVCHIKFSFPRHLKCTQELKFPEDQSTRKRM